LLLASAATVAWLARVGGGREGPGDGSGSPPSPRSKRHLACRVALPGGAESPRPSPHATRKKTSRQWAGPVWIASGRMGLLVFLPEAQPIKY
jgi:hypothetical protein